MTFQSRQHLLVAIATAAILLFGLDRLVISPLAANWKDRATRIQLLKHSVTQGNLLLQRRDTIQTRWEQMSAQTLPSQFSAAEDWLLKSFNRWATASGASIGSIRPQWKSNDPDYMLLECRADASGDLTAVARFLYELEKDPLALKVDRMEITSNDINGTQLTLTLQVSALLLAREEQL